MIILNFQTDHKVHAVKTLRAITGIGLYEAKVSIEQGLVIDTTQIDSVLWHFEEHWGRCCSPAPMPTIMVRRWKRPDAPFELPITTAIWER